jgi:sugar phosphate isomerase/epimerase
MKVYASSVLLYAYRLEESFKIARDLGYDGVEVWHYHLRQTGESPAALGRLARQLDLSLSVHALSWDLNFTSMLPESREASLRLLETSIDVGAELEAGPVVVHPGRITAPGDTAEAYWPLLVEGVARLARHAAGRGLTVSLELMEHIPREFFILPKDTERLIQEVNAPNLSITFDAAHVPWQEEPLAYLKRMSGVRHVHLSDANERQFHLALGQGKRDFKPLIAYLRDQLDVPVAIEGRIEFERSTGLAAQNKAMFDNLLS